MCVCAVRMLVCVWNAYVCVCVCVWTRARVPERIPPQQLEVFVVVVVVFTSHSSFIFFLFILHRRIAFYTPLNYLPSRALTKQTNRTVSEQPPTSCTRVASSSGGIVLRHV